jgi:hypothetical protein
MHSLFPVAPFVSIVISVVLAPLADARLFCCPVKMGRLTADDLTHWPFTGTTGNKDCIAS